MAAYRDEKEALRHQKEALAEELAEKEAEVEQLREQLREQERDAENERKLQPATTTDAASRGELRRLLRKKPAEATFTHTSKDFVAFVVMAVACPIGVLGVVHDIYGTIGGGTLLTVILVGAVFAGAAVVASKKNHITYVTAEGIEIRANKAVILEIRWGDVEEIIDGKRDSTLLRIRTTKGVLHDIQLKNQDIPRASELMASWMERTRIKRLLDE